MPVFGRLAFGAGIGCAPAMRIDGGIQAMTPPQISSGIRIWRVCARFAVFGHCRPTAKSFASAWRNRWKRTN